MKLLKNIKKKSIKNKIDPKITKKYGNQWFGVMLIFKEEILKRNNYLLWGGNFFSTKISCFLVAGLYFLTFNLTLAFSPALGFFT